MTEEEKFEQDVKEAEDKLAFHASCSGYKVTDNLHKIARAKVRFFGIENIWKCPCFPPEDTEHGCQSKACAKEIATQGICHCKLYKKKD